MTQADLMLYSCAWNYLFFIARIAMHIYKFQEIARSSSARQKLFVLEVFDTIGTLILGAGTTLSLLANIHVIHGILAVAFSPLATLAPAFTALTKGIIELFYAHRNYRRTHLPYLLLDSVKQYSRAKEKCEQFDSNSSEYASQHEQLVVLREKVLAFARVAYMNNQMSADEILNLLREFNLRSDRSLDPTNLLFPATNEQKVLVSTLLESQWDQAREHVLNAVFWITIGVGAALASVATFFFPPLLIPAIIVIVLAVAVKGAHLLEVDRRVANVFRKKENQVAIKNDNPVFNYLARRHKESDVISAYLKSDRMNNVLKIHKNEHCSEEMRVKLRLAYELAERRSGNTKIDEAAFYQAVLKLPWLRRRKLLNRAMEVHIEQQALSCCSFLKGLTKPEKDSYVAAYCRKNYRFFSRSMSTETCSEQSETYGFPSKGTYCAT